MDMGDVIVVLDTRSINYTHLGLAGITSTERARNTCYDYLLQVQVLGLWTPVKGRLAV